MIIRTLLLRSLLLLMQKETIPTSITNARYFLNKNN